MSCMRRPLSALAGVACGILLVLRVLPWILQTSATAPVRPSTYAPPPPAAPSPLIVAAAATRPPHLPRPSTPSPTGALPVSSPPPSAAITVLVTHRNRTMPTVLLPGVVFTAHGGVPPSALKDIPVQLPSRGAFPPCLWEQLDGACQLRHAKSFPPGDLHAEWHDGVACVSRHGKRVSRMRRVGAERGHPLLDVQLSRGCAPDLVEPPPPIGHASLPLEAMQRAVAPLASSSSSASASAAASAAAAAATAPSAALRRLRAKLAHGNATTLSIVALGASVTDLFANVCSEKWKVGGCASPAFESAAALDERLRKLRRAQGLPPNAEEADWLVQLLRTLKHGFPRLGLHIRSVAYGGMVPTAITPCVNECVHMPNVPAPTSRFLENTGYDPMHNPLAQPPHNPSQPLTAPTTARLCLRVRASASRSLSALCSRRRPSM